MTSDAKIGLLLGLVFIFIIGFIIKGLPTFHSTSPEDQQAIMAIRLRVASMINEVNVPNTEQTISWLTPEVQQRIVDHLVGEIIQFANTKDQMQQAIDVQLSQIDKRVRTIESKFPDETDLSKTSLLNNTLLATRIDHLSKQLDQIQAELLTRWDVALVVVAIITGIVSVLFTSFAVVKAIGKPKRRY